MNFRSHLYVLHRRHLDASQRAAIAVEIEPLFAKEAAQRQKAGVKVTPKMAEGLVSLAKMQPKLSAQERSIFVRVAARTIIDTGWQCYALTFTYRCSVI